MKEKRVRDKQMIVRFTERELSEFTDKMKHARSKSRSDFIMSLVKNKPIIVPDGLPEIAAELKRHGNNLNQIARLFNQTKSCPYQLNHALENCETSYNAVKNFIFEINGRR
ncbi:MAG: MobC family plasmid mobilization relaxosome protein [Ruminococcus sp.]|nr:MobC family plasmid mobilization relaxosome protein [Ruminococcus sp.]